MLSTLLHWFAYSYVPSRGSSEARTSTLSTSSRFEGNSEFANIHSPGILPPIGSEFHYAQARAYRYFNNKEKFMDEVIGVTNGYGCRNRRKSRTVGYLLNQSSDKPSTTTTGGKLCFVDSFASSSLLSGD
ncbi:unnamed protein product [Dovyalis caffra]|uniref:Uncharacterized protein n=1 Tax=Dovyalis caffra TaxID=77055 RepID=A0AAV1R712_9ROSI|nr:unnamed protein product [Dovyalis caffra]